MKRLYFLSILSLFIFSCNVHKGDVNEDLCGLLKDFVGKNDFEGAFFEEDSCISVISTCLSVMLYDIDDIHYLTLVCSQIPVDFFDETNNPNIYRNPTCYYRIQDKDVFVFNHTNQKENILFPSNNKNISDAQNMEKLYKEKDEIIFETIHKETYTYEAINDKVIFKIDTQIIDLTKQ